MALRSLDAMLQRRDLYFVVFQTCQHLVAGADVKSLAKGHRKDYAAILINAEPNVSHNQPSMTLDSLESYSSTHDRFWKKYNSARGARPALRPCGFSSGAGCCRVARITARLKSRKAELRALRYIFFSWRSPRGRTQFGPTPAPESRAPAPARPARGILRCSQRARKVAQGGGGDESIGNDAAMLDLAHGDGIGKDHVHGGQRFGVGKGKQELLQHVAASGGRRQHAARGLQESLADGNHCHHGGLAPLANQFHVLVRRAELQ